MKCPIDDTELMMSERHGVEIDYCPKCRGVWLDRGELDKIIDQAAGAMTLPEPKSATPPPPPPVREYREPYRETERPREYREPYRDDHHDDRRYSKKYSKKRRAKSFLEDIFDFD